MALQLYDLTLDDYRAPTQADIDQLSAIAAAYGHLRATIEQDFRGLQDVLAKIRSEHGWPR